MSLETPEENLEEAEIFLASLSPRSPSRGFAERVATESILRGMRLTQPSAGFVERVVTGSVASPRVIPFPWPVFSLSAAAAVFLGLFFAGIGSSRAPDSVDPEFAAVLPDWSDEVVAKLGVSVSDFPPSDSPGAPHRQYFHTLPGGAVVPVSLGVHEDPARVIFD